MIEKKPGQKALLNLVKFNLLSEGGTEEDRRIDPPLNFGIFIENNNNIWKKLGQSSPR